jgi:hypothetical protein
MNSDLLTQLNDTVEMFVQRWVIVLKLNYRNVCQL